MTSCTADVLGPRPDPVGPQATPIERLRYVLACMERDVHHNLVDIPVSVNLDSWIEQIKGLLRDLPVRDRRVEAAFREGYNAMRRQYHLADDADAAWEQSVSKQALG